MCVRATTAPSCSGFTISQIGAIIGRMPALTRPQKITFGEMRDTGVRGVLIYCADYHCSHSIAISADKWPDDVRLPRFVCKACCSRGADVRPDFNWNRAAIGGMGYR
jgi:hypothetical protein